MVSQNIPTSYQGTKKSWGAGLTHVHTNTHFLPLGPQVDCMDAQGYKSPSSSKCVAQGIPTPAPGGEKRPGGNPRKVRTVPVVTALNLKGRWGRVGGEREGGGGIGGGGR